LDAGGLDGVRDALWKMMRDTHANDVDTRQFFAVTD
jgi:hypothetical protein